MLSVGNLMAQYSTEIIQPIQLKLGKGVIARKLVFVILDFGISWLVSLFLLRIIHNSTKTKITTSTMKAQKAK